MRTAARAHASQAAERGGGKRTGDGGRVALAVDAARTLVPQASVRRGRYPLQVHLLCPVDRA